MTDPISPSADPASAPVRAWVVSDGAAGNERQVLALAAAMGLAPTVQRIALPAPWRWFAPRLLTGARVALRDFAPPWPDIAIGCGRQAALLTRILRGCSGGTTFTVQILDPRVDPALFDVVIAPQHDGIDGANVIRTLGALNPVDDGWIARAAEEFSTLRQLPQPLTALLIGGPRRDLALDAAWLDSLIARLEDLLARDGGSLLISLSRRTPAHWRERLRGAFHNGCMYFWGDARDGTNPYPGYLAHADRFVVTPDSVNMLSEACATGKPVFSLLPSGARGKLAAFHAMLRAQSRLHDLGNVDISTLPPILPLRETAAVAEEVWRRFQAHVPPAQHAAET